MDFVKNRWKPRATFRVTRVNRQSYKVGFYRSNDFERLRGSKWDHIGEDILIVRPWTEGMNLNEDVLDTVPLKAIIHNIPAAMWWKEVVGRIVSFLGIPLEAKAMKSNHPRLPPPLVATMVISKKFSYPPRIMIRRKGNEGEPERDIVVSVEYRRRASFCPKCEGYGHWPQQCRGRGNVRSRGWNEYIARTQKDLTGKCENLGEQEYFSAKMNNSKIKKRTCRSHRRRQARREYRRERQRLQTETRCEENESRKEREKISSTPNNTNSTRDLEIPPR